MSSFAATGWALALYAAVTAPILLTVFRTNVAGTMSAAWSAGALAIVAYSLGIGPGGAKAPYDIRDLQGASAAGGCGQILTALRRVGALRTSPQGRPVIVRSVWDRLPDEARVSVQSCLPDISEQPAASARPRNPQ
jgi:hypothetical protein